MPIGSLKSAYSVGNINTAVSLQKNTNQFASRPKGSPPHLQGSFLDYTSILIHSLSYLMYKYSTISKTHKEIEVH